MLTKTLWAELKPKWPLKYVHQHHGSYAGVSNTLSFQFPHYTEVGLQVFPFRECTCGTENKLFTVIMILKENQPPMQHTQTFSVSYSAYKL